MCQISYFIIWQHLGEESRVNLHYKYLNGVLFFLVPINLDNSVLLGTFILSAACLAQLNTSFVIIFITFFEFGLRSPVLFLFDSIAANIVCSEGFCPFTPCDLPLFDSDIFFLVSSERKNLPSLLTLTLLYSGSYKNIYLFSLPSIFSG